MQSSVNSDAFDLLTAASILVPDMFLALLPRMLLLPRSDNPAPARIKQRLQHSGAEHSASIIESIAVVAETEISLYLESARP